jgi:hypothetical protein
MPTENPNPNTASQKNENIYFRPGKMRLALGQSLINSMRDAANSEPGGERRDPVYTMTASEKQSLGGSLVEEMKQEADRDPVPPQGSISTPGTSSIAAAAATGISPTGLPPARQDPSRPVFGTQQNRPAYEASKRNGPNGGQSHTR